MFTGALTGAFSVLPVAYRHVVVAGDVPVVAVVAHPGHVRGGPALTVGVRKTKHRQRDTAQVNRRADLRVQRVPRKERDVAVPGDIAIAGGVGHARARQRERGGDEHLAGRSRQPPDFLHIVTTPIPALRSRALRPAIFSADAPASKAPTARAANESLLIPGKFAALSAVPGMGMPPPVTPFRAGMLTRPASDGRSARPGRASSPASWDAAGTFVSPAPAPAPILLSKVRPVPRSRRGRAARCADDALRPGDRPTVVPLPVSRLLRFAPVLDRRRAVFPSGRGAR